MNKKFKILILITAVLGVLAVGMGAFGSHMLREKLTLEGLNAYKTAVQYHFIHTLALFGTALLYRIYRIKGLFFIGLFFLGGICLFSGSLYMLSIKNLLGIESLDIIGILTPIGGLALMGCWAAIFFTVVRIKT
jgi:uncharacterized membrane protein YgdD (TMEM256/DUF423 family)